MRRKITGIIAAVGALVLLAGCTSAPADKGDGASGSKGSKEITLITNNLGEEYWQASADAVEAKGKELGYKVTVTSHNGDTKKESELVDAAITAHPAAVLLDPANADGSIGSVEKLVEAKIPVFIVNAEINQEGLATAQLVSDNAQGATIGAQEFSRLMGGTGTFAQINGPSSDNNALTRTSSYDAVVSQFPDMKRVANESIAWDTALGRNTTQSLLQAHPDITGILAGGDGFAAGALAAVDQAGKAGKIIIGGFDGAPSIIAAIKAGTVNYTVLQPVVEFSEQAVVQADSFVRTGKTGADAEKQLFPCTLITAENVDKVTSAYTLSK